MRVSKLLRARSVLAVGALLVGIVPAFAAGTSGDLDGGFGTGGVVTAGDQTVWSAAARPTDGAVVIGGRRPKSVFNGSTTYEWTIRRFTASGQVDTSFAGGGNLARFGDYGVDEVYAVACDGVGRTVVGGNAHFAETSGSGRKATTLYPLRGVVLRLDSQGALDTTFGTGGQVVLDFPVFAVVALPDGRVLAAGQRGGDPAVARLLSSGALDSTYGVGGIAVDTRWTASCGRVMGLAVQSTGAAVLGWRGTNTVKSKGLTTTVQVWQVTRMTAAGAADSTFLSAERPGEYIGGIVVASDDRIFASGVTASDPREVVVTSVDPDGVPLSAFGGDGEVRWSSHASQTSVGAPMLQPAGQLLIPSHFSDGVWEAAPVRLLADGSLDGSFGAAGEGQALNLGTGVQTRTWGLAPAADGAILMFGDYVGSPSGVFLARYVP